MLRLFQKLQRLFWMNEARVFLRQFSTRREKWIGCSRLNRRSRKNLVYGILIIYIFFMYLADMRQGGTLFQAYIDNQNEKLIDKELEAYYIFMGYTDQEYIPQQTPPDTSLLDIIKRR